MAILGPDQLLKGHMYSGLAESEVNSASLICVFTAEKIIGTFLGNYRGCSWKASKYDRKKLGWKTTECTSTIKKDWLFKGLICIERRRCCSLESGANRVQVYPISKSNQLRRLMVTLSYIPSCAIWRFESWNYWQFL